MRIWLAMICSIVCSPLLSAQSLPAVQFYMNSAYMCGGIGSDQSEAFKSARNLYPLSLNFGQKQGDRVAFVADVQVVMRDAQDQTVLNINSDGPFCLLDIDYGTYQVYVTYEGQTLHQSIHIKQQGHQLSFVWPEAQSNPSH
ncbi:carboxypeptidase regulatory-like domain-containing protein [Paenalcaligenes faecalis]|uniref:carboxypeptidase regulatory-like domain-containing protein n=1 Tax=Paenalcaligenes faecalis TaxID=2980099 RepID=UPI0022B95E4E|nr:carboxypeptidase regulatory-like domain-containing protein [Paenalcaligenes faecalis]